MTLIFKLVVSLFLNAHAHCPNAFTHNEQEFCVDLEWQETDIQRGESRMSPYLNIGNPLPFNTHFSKVWVQIWKKGDSTHQMLNPEGLTIKPFMLMLEEPDHNGFSENNYDEEMGVQLSKLKLEKMNGCWTISLQAEDLLHLIKIESYTNLDFDENFEQMSICNICSTPEPGDHGDHSGHDHH